METSPFNSLCARSFTEDSTYVFFCCLVLCMLRLAVCGASKPGLRKFPSVFKFLFNDLMRPNKEGKFCENLWYALWHSMSFTVLMYLLFRESLTSIHPGWTRLFIKEFPSFRWYWVTTPTELELYQTTGYPDVPLTIAIRTIYLTELAFWISCLMFLFIEVAREDFYAMLIHHVATCILIVVSYNGSAFRFGLVVMFIHDAADIFLYTAKYLHYSVAPRWPVDAWFIGFVLVYFISRLFLYPWICVWPSIQAWAYGTSSTNRDSDLSWGASVNVIFPLLLTILQLLHIFWFRLIVKMVVRSLKEQTVTQGGDIRSDDDSTAPSSSICTTNKEPPLTVPGHRRRKYMPENSR